MSGRDRLSPMQTRVLQLASDGLTLRQIAERLFLAYPTAKAHAEAIRRRLGATGMTHAVAIGLREELIA